KGRGGAETERLAGLLDGLKQAAPWLDLAGHEDRLAGSDDMFDALVASLTARAVALGLTLRPDSAHAKAARTEGWIHLPTGGLDGLGGGRP
ncbi:MAG: DUF429 domain-containing protein, partial [Arthrobacter sp.]|nr:DUF429 domain-containing protein [Arthrobacter sp.]